MRWTSCTPAHTADWPKGLREQFDLPLATDRRHHPCNGGATGGNQCALGAHQPPAARAMVRRQGSLAPLPRSHLHDPVCLQRSGGHDRANKPVPTGWCESASVSVRKPNISSGCACRAARGAGCQGAIPGASSADGWMLRWRANCWAPRLVTWSKQALARLRAAVRRACAARQQGRAGRRGLHGGGAGSRTTGLAKLGPTKSARLSQVSVMRRVRLLE